MKLIFCTDERGGMMFNKRRVSRDKLLVEDVANYVGDNILYAEPYSLELFADASVNLICSDSPEKSADTGDYAFIESYSPKEAAREAEEIVIYNWNRRYPFDVSLEFRPEDLGFRLKTRYKFKGSSHDLITREVYTK